MGTLLRIAGIIRESIVDGPGIRLVVFAQGCKHHCPGCHNPETHLMDGGRMVEIDSVLEEIRKNLLLDGITLSGGEPFEQAEGFAELAAKAKQLKMNIMTYTGYTYEEIVANAGQVPGWDQLLSQTDILVDGRFILEKRNLLMKFRGSENQRIIDLNETRRENKLIFADIP